MSVLVAKRKMSKAEFVSAARELFELSLHCAKKFPKSITFYVTQDFVSCARRVYTGATVANNIYLKDEETKATRRRYLQNALESLSAFEGLLGILFDCYHSSQTDYSWRRFGELVAQERSLLRSVIEADRKRFPAE